MKPRYWRVGKPFKDTGQIPIIERIIEDDPSTGVGVALVTDHKGASYCDTPYNIRLIMSAPQLLSLLTAYANDDECDIDGAPDATNFLHNETCRYCQAQTLIRLIGKRKW